MDKLLTGHFYFLRNRRSPVFCYFFIVPQEFKSENQNLRRPFLRTEKHWERTPSYLSPINMAVPKLHLSKLLSTTPRHHCLCSRDYLHLNLKAVYLHLIFCSRQAGVGWGSEHFINLPDMSDPFVSNQKVKFLILQST